MSVGCPLSQVLKLMIRCCQGTSVAKDDGGVKNSECDP